MKQRVSLPETLNDHVSSGVLTEEQALHILHAPRWSYTPRELLSYLAALIITVGVIRTVAAALVDVSESTIAVLMYLLAAVIGGVSFRLKDKSEIQSRISEVLEVAATLSAAIATGIVCDIANLESLGGDFFVPTNPRSLEQFSFQLGFQHLLFRLQQD